MVESCLEHISNLILIGKIDGQRPTTTTDDDDDDDRRRPTTTDDRRRNLWKNVSEYISEYVSEYTSKYVSEYTSEYISECTSERTSDYVREYISEYVSEYTSEYISEYTSAQNPKTPWFFLRSLNGEIKYNLLIWWTEICRTNRPNSPSKSASSSLRCGGGKSLKAGQIRRNKTSASNLKNSSPDSVTRFSTRTIRHSTVPSVHLQRNLEARNWRTCSRKCT